MLIKKLLILGFAFVLIISNLSSCKNKIVPSQSSTLSIVLSESSTLSVVSSESSNVESSISPTTPASSQSITPTKPVKSSTTLSVEPTVTIKPELKLWESKKMNYGIMIMGLEPDDLDPNYEMYVKSNYINQLIINGNDSEQIKMAFADAKKYNLMIWVNIHQYKGMFTWAPNNKIMTELVSNWKEKFNQLVDEIKATGAWDKLAGWYLDEPLSNRMLEQSLIDVTKYGTVDLKKRFMVIEGTPGVNPEWWDFPASVKKGYNTVCSPENSKYITDYGFDVYWDVPEYKYRYDETILKVKQKLGNRSDVKIWYVPTIMSSGGKTSESVAMRHFNQMYDYLKAEANPGGLMCYTYEAIGDDAGTGNVGLSQIKYRLGQEWTNMKNLIMNIGKKICSGKLN